MEHFVGTPAHKHCDEVGEAKGEILVVCVKYWKNTLINLRKIYNLF
ncbi:hypothetical protein [Methanotorris formicicus]|nr:hypothetical protein [Methanotorris formicicus]